MARSPIQFQKGISLNEFLSLYGTEQQASQALYQWRWPSGFVCPNCGHDRSCQLTTHKLQQCYRVTANLHYRRHHLRFHQAPAHGVVPGHYFMTQGSRR